MFKKSKFKTQLKTDIEELKDQERMREREKDFKSFLHSDDNNKDNINEEDEYPVILCNSINNTKTVNTVKPSILNNTDEKDENSFPNKMNKMTSKVQPKGVYNLVPIQQNKQIPPKTEDVSTIKKVFLSETLLEQAKSPEELQNLLGHRKEDIEKIKEKNRSEIIDLQKELFTLPNNLNQLRTL